MEKNNKMMIVVIVLLVILLGAMVAGGIIVYNTITSAANSEVQEEQEDVEPEDKSLNTIISIGDAISTNLLVGEDQKEHLAKIDFSLDVKGGEDDSEAVVTAINNRLVSVRDIVNGILRKKTFEELKKNDGLENLKDEILDKIRKEFDTNLVSNIYISSFMLQ